MTPIFRSNRHCFPRRALSLGLAAFLVFSGFPVSPVIYAEDPLISSAFPLGQPVMTLAESNQKALQQVPDEEIPLDFLLHNESALSAASFVSTAVTQFSELPAVEAVGYNKLGKQAPYVGYVRLNGIDKSHFSYKYDLGAAPGAAVDVVIRDEEQMLNLESGFAAVISRQNQGGGTGGLGTLHYLFEDADGTVLEMSNTLNAAETQVFFDLVAADFDRTQVRKITLRQSFEDLAPNRVGLDRRGEIFVMLSGIQTLYPAEYETPPQETAPLKPEGALWSWEGANRSRGASLPGYGRTGESDRGYSLVYRLIAHRDAFVKGVLELQDPLAVRHHVKLALGNVPSPVQALVRFVDEAGNFAEYLVEMDSAMRLFDFDTSDSFFFHGPFDRTRVAKIEIETDRSLTKDALGGQVSLEIFELEEDPFESLLPEAAVIPNSAGQAKIGPVLSVTGAVVYQLQVATDEAFTNVVHEGFPADGVEYVSLAEGSYFTRIRASKNQQVETGPVTLWSQPTAFDVGPDTFTSIKPTLASVQPFPDGRVAVEINVVPSAYAYEIQVASDEAFTQDLVTVFSVDTAEELHNLAAGDYFVRVRARINEFDGLSPKTLYSDAAPFTINPPSIEDFKPYLMTLLESETTAGQFDYALHTLDLALGYQVQVARDNAFTDLVTEQEINAASGSFDLVDHGVYFFRFRGSAGNPLNAGPFSSWSDPFAFEYPDDVYSGNKVSGVFAEQIPGPQMRITFDEVPGTLLYQIQIANDANFGDVIYQGFPANPEETLALQACATCYIRVRGSAAPQIESGIVTQWSDTLIYTGDPITKLKPSVVTVNSSFSGEDSVFFNGAAGAVTHQYQISTAEDFSQIVAQGYSPASPVVVVLNELRTYFIRVRGIKYEPVDPSPKSQWSDTFIFDKVIAGQSITPTAGLTSNDLTEFPGTLFPTSVGPGGDAIDQAEATARGVKITYDTGSQIFSGGGFSYDNFGTQPIEFQDLSSSSEMVFGIKGSISQVKFELVDATGNSSFIRLSGIRSDLEQFWRIPLSILPGVDKSKVRLIYFIVEGPGHAGTLEINRIRPAAPPSGALQPDAALTGSDLTVFPQGSAGPLRVTSIGSGGDTQDNATPTVRGVEIDYNTGSNGFAGGGFSYDDFGTQAIESGNVNLLEEFIFGIKGTASQVKFEVVDASGANASVDLGGISSSEEKFWKIPLSLLTGVDLSQLRLMYFIVTGGGKAGTLYINHVRPDLGIAPSPLLTVLSPTPLPDKNPLTVGPVDSTANVTITPRGLQTTYSTGPIGWVGTGYSFSGSTDALASLDSIVLGLKGSPSAVKLEITDLSERRVTIPLTGILPGVEQFWQIPLSLFKALDVANLKSILFIVEGQNLNGQLEVNDQPGLEIFLPSAQSPATLVGLPSPVPGFPRETSVGPGSGGATDLGLPAPRGMQLFYNTGTPGWAGGGFTYDDFGTGPVESGDLSGLAELQFGIKGDADSVKFEIIDDQQNHYQARIEGIEQNTEKVWKIPTSMITGIDLTHVRLIYFIVEGENRVGQLEINHLAVPTFILPSLDLSPEDLTGLPDGSIGAPRETSVGPGGTATDAAVRTESGVVVTYNTANEGWAGGGLTYDDFSTGPVETGDLSGLQELRFGLHGADSQAKLEIIDANGQKFNLNLQAIPTDTDQIFSVSTAWMTNLDLTKIRLIYFIVEGFDKSGSLAIDILPPPFELTPSPTLTPADIPDISSQVNGLADLVTVHPSQASSSISTLASDRGILLNYGTSTGGWAGGGFDFDDSATGPVEVGDFSALSMLRFGVKGTPERVKLEIIDANGDRQAIPVVGILSDTEQVWELSFTHLTDIDISKIRLIYFIIEGDSQNGSLEVTFAPPA